jgi:hypothetical protein
MNTVTTKNSANWFEFLGLRAHGFRQPPVRFARANVIWIQQTTPSARSGLRPVSTSATYRISDSWETITYTALWLCGLIAIGLCWV